MTAACRQDMQDQPRYEVYEKSDFFKDGQASRPLIEGTVPRGYLKDDTFLYAGKQTPGGEVVDTFPFPVTEELVTRGQERYQIWCSVCHGLTGAGDGMIVRRGYKQPPSFHDDRLRKAPVGHFFDVITNGYGSMPKYGEYIPARDRWAIISYIRALQLTRQSAAPSNVVAGAPAGKSVNGGQD
jgi:mono/diheme cytochrome c family protein